MPVGEIPDQTDIVNRIVDLNSARTRDSRRNGSTSRHCLRPAHGSDTFLLH